MDSQRQINRFADFLDRESVAARASRACVGAAATTLSVATVGLALWIGGIAPPSPRVVLLAGIALAPLGAYLSLKRSGRFWGLVQGILFGFAG